VPLSEAAETGRTDIVPHALRLKLQAVAVLRLLPVLARVALVIAPTAHKPAHQAHPQVILQVALLPAVGNKQEVKESQEASALFR
jgi:hypothetical protein